MDTWERGDPYERYVGRWSRRVAPKFLSWLAAPDGRRWLDVGCGTGALCAAILEHCAPASVAGVEPSEGFLGSAKKNLGSRVALHHGNAQSLPLEDDAADIVVSGLVLNFVPDPRRALQEMRRVATTLVGAYVWDYADKMELMRYFWDAAAEVDPGAAKLDEGARFPLCRPEALRELVESAGLRGAEVTAIDIETRFASFEDYWAPFLGGQGPAPAYAMSLDEAARARLRERLRERLPADAHGGIALVARAWAVRAEAG